MDREGACVAYYVNREGHAFRRGYGPYAREEEAIEEISRDFHENTRLILLSIVLIPDPQL